MSERLFSRSTTTIPLRNGDRSPTKDHVIERLVNRALTPDSFPGQRGQEDTDQIELLVEGGAMRGSRGAGEIRWLMEHGVPIRVFDRARSTSGGGAHLICYAADLPRATDIYTKTLIANPKESGTNTRFASLSRGVLGGRVVNPEVLPNVLRQKLGDPGTQAVLDCPTPLHFALTDTKTGKGVDVVNHDLTTANQLYDVIKWSCWLPVLCDVIGQPLPPYVDGGVANGGIPFSPEVQMALTLLTTKEGEQISIASLIEKIGAGILRLEGHTELAKTLSEAQLRYKLALAQIDRSPHIRAVRVSADSPDIPMLEKDPAKITHAQIDGYRAMDDVFAPYLDELPTRQLLVSSGR